jgi:hypothetical protein
MHKKLLDFLEISPTDKAPFITYFTVICKIKGSETLNQ